MGIRNHFDHVPDVVEDQQGVRKKKKQVGDIEVIRIPVGQFLEKTDNIIAHESHRPPEETGQRGIGDRPVLSKNTFEHFQRIALKRSRFSPAVPDDLNLVGGAPDHD